MTIICLAAKGIECSRAVLPGHAEANAEQRLVERSCGSEAWSFKNFMGSGETDALIACRRQRTPCLRCIQLTDAIDLGLGNTITGRPSLLGFEGGTQIQLALGL